MPLLKKIQANSDTTIYIWKIEETLGDLSKEVQFTVKNKDRFAKMKSEQHQKGFLAVRHLFKVAGFLDSDVIYDEYGKPHLKDGRFLSISHSFNYCGLIVSTKTSVGIDVEKQRDKILKIARKFTPLEEYNHLNKVDLIKKLTVVWGAKESLYKIYGKKKLSFKEHIFVEDFMLESKSTTGEIRYEKENKIYKINFLEFDDFTCVYVFN